MEATTPGDPSADAEAARPPVIVTRLLAEASSRPVAEQVVLPAERRLFLKRRWRGVAVDGAEFGFDLETRLRDGAVIHQTDKRDYVIRQEHEAVYVLRPVHPDEAALMGWKIGNLHMPVEVRAGEIRIVHDPAVRQLLEREGWPFEESMMLFNPLRVTAHAS